MARDVWIALCLVCLIGMASTADAQTTALFYDAQPTVFGASEQQATITPATATFHPISDGVSVRFLISSVTFSGDLWFIADPTLGAPLSVGPYESAKRATFNPFNGLSATINGHGCNELTGRFVVQEVAFAQDGSLLQFAADFEQHCEGATPALFGSIRYNSTISTLIPFGGQYPTYSLKTGNVSHGTVTGGGLSCGTGGATCQVSLGSPAAVQLTATPDPGYIFTGWTGDCLGIGITSITVYGPRVCGATFDTAIQTTPRTILLWNSAVGDTLSQGQSNVYSLANAIWSTFRFNNGRDVIQVSLTGVTATGENSLNLRFSAPSGATLQPGTYLGATTLVSATTTPGMDISGDRGRGCNATSGQFTIREIESGSGGTLAKLNMDFEQFCDSSTAPLTGTIEFNSTIAIPPPPTVSIDKTQLTFGAARAAGTLATQTSAQEIRLVQSGVGTVSWSASSNVPWLVVSPTSGTGSATLTASVQFDASLPAAPSTASGSITIVTAGAANAVGPISVSLNLLAPSSPAGAPFGAFDTPADGSTGVSGSISVTGWALDDIEVTRVRIFRDPAAGEAPGSQVFIGNAVLIDGARPDVAAAFPSDPRSGRGGWGYLMLTNMLPNQGNGTFKLYAYADDADGHTALLGTKTITCDNAHATLPFGAIDTPGQGEVVSGVVGNFGWVLSAGQRRADPPGGGAVTVFVDGAPVGSPTGWTHRDDLSGLFPSSQYAGVDTALGLFGLDTTALANGVHTIAWAVTDDVGVTAGIGSRFFTVSNGSSLVAAPHAAQALRPALVPDVSTILLGRRGFDLDAPLEYYFPDRDGVVTIDARELDRIELQLEPGATGVLITPQGEKPLPIGAHIDPATGLFTWAPASGYVGRYELVLGGHRVRIVLRPTGRSGKD